MRRWTWNAKAEEMYADGGQYSIAATGSAEYPFRVRMFDDVSDVATLPRAQEMCQKHHADITARMVAGDESRKVAVAEMRKACEVTE